MGRELCKREAMDEAIDALNRLAAWFGKIFAVSNDGFWKISNTFTPSNAIISNETTDVMRPMAVIDFADDGSIAERGKLLAIRRTYLETSNVFYITLRQLGFTLENITPLSSGPYTRVYVSIDDEFLVKNIPKACEDIISRRTSYVSESDYYALKKGLTTSPTFFNKPITDTLSVLYWQALCISKRDYLRLLRIEMWRDHWQAYGNGLFGKIVPGHIQQLRDCTRTEGNVDEQFEAVKKVIEHIPEDIDPISDENEQTTPPSVRHPKVRKLYKRLKWEIKLICERIEERRPSPTPSTRS